MKRTYHIVVFILIECILFFGIGVFAWKLWNVHKKQVKGVQVARMDQTDLIFPSGGPELSLYYEPKPNSVIDWHPDWLENGGQHRINADGLNEAVDYPVEKNDFTYRIITLGDSFTYGQYVAESENYSSRLEEQLNSSLQCDGIKRFEVINFGVYGYDVMYSVRRFETRGQKYRPDLVLWLLNDWNFEKINEYLLPIMDELEKKGVQDFDEKTKRYEIAVQSIERMKQQYGEEKILQYQRDAFLRMASIYSRDLLVFSFKNNMKDYKKLINEFMTNSPRYHYADILPNIWSKKKYVLLDDHPSPEGHALIASKIFTYIADTFLPSCTQKGSS